jgi:hypothetical protein
MNKILIYTAAGLANAGLRAGVNAAGQAVRKRAYTGAILPDDASNGTASLYGSQYPVYFKKITGDEVGKKWAELNSDFWQAPIDPIVSVSGRNLITRRNVSKTQAKNFRGSVKELWSQDDWSVSISGVFLGPTAADDLQMLVEMVNYQGDVAMYCDLFDRLEIYSLVIESFTFNEPSPGLYKWSLTCVSDDSYDLLVETDS